MNTDKFDIYEPPKGHFERFQLKLEARDNIGSKAPIRWVKLMVAASVVILLGLGSVFLLQVNQELELSDVSPELKETQDYFMLAIYQKITEVEALKNEDNATMINDALIRIELLEENFHDLKQDLNTTGFNKPIIHAMIQNYQQRITVLQDLLERLTQLKFEQNEIQKPNTI